MDTNGSKSALCVFVRVRPLNETERQHGAFECLSVVDSKRLLLVDPEKFGTDALRQHRALEREFRFDAVVGTSAGEDEVQALLGAEGLVDQLVRNGHNGTVLAYGPTGTGKTHTMVGTRQRPGLMTRMTRALYERLAEMGDRDTRVYISFMELYNELIRDLLKAERNGPLELLEDDRGNVHVPNLSRVRASNTTKLLQLLQEGNARRTQEPTAANATSSRSHALLMISLWRGERQRGKLFLIDLAGSERAAHTQNQGQRLKEGAAINRSLLALGNVINALSTSGGRKTFVNFRDSKLTRLLKDSLGGAGENGARTVLIAHISPSSTHYDETFNTLTYASRAKNINYRLNNPQHRPASADRSYSEALATLRHEAERAGLLEGAGGGVGHSASTGQLNDPGTLATTNGNGTTRGGGMPRGPAPHSPPANRRRVPESIPPLPRPSQPHPPPQSQSSSSSSTTKLPRLGSSLFDSLRDQHLATTERQQRLRERLMKANSEHYELELARKGRMDILKAWEAQKENGGGGIDQIEKVAGRVRAEVAEKESRMSELAELRHRLENALRRGEQGQRQLESRMRGLAKDQQQIQVIELIRTLAKQQAESNNGKEGHGPEAIYGAAIHSDFALQDKRLRRQESQLRRMRRYERVADRLIDDGEAMDDQERARLHREYRVLRSQLEGIGPAESGLPSWNTQMLARTDRMREAEEGQQQQQRRRRSEDERVLYGGNVELGKTFTVLRPRVQQQEEEQRLPEVGRRTRRREAEEEEVMSETGENRVPPKATAMEDDHREDGASRDREGSLPPL